MSTNSWQVTTFSERETEELGRALGIVLDVPLVIGLTGQLGAGKTAFARGLLRGLGVQGYVRSPTFTLVHSYRGRIGVHHVDAYRLEGAAEAADIGLQELIEEHSVVVIEWADRVRDMLPDERMEVRIAKPDGGDRFRRDIIVTAAGTACDEVLMRWRRAVEEGFGGIVQW